MTLRVEVRHADTDEVVYQSRPRTHTFPDNPLTVHGWPVRLRRLRFPEPGLYWVQVWAGQAMLAQQPLRLG